MSLENEIAIVTGASRGIGAAIARILGEQGATVIGTATTAGGAEAISTTFADGGLSGKGQVLNVADNDSIAAFMQAVTADYGAATILVNNAGITRDNLLLRMKDDEWNDIMTTNLGSVFRMSKACLRGMMKAKRGRIISITSVVGAMGNAGQANYAAAKAGVEGFTRSVAREIGSRGITVNTVAPGFIDTDMTRALDDDQRAAMLSGIPLGRLGSVDDVAQAVAFLASPAAAYITGSTLHVHGGMLLA